MRVILNEIKKIWNFRILCILAVICVLFFIMLMEFEVTAYRKSHSNSESIFYCEELMRLYGPSITEEEMTEFVAEERERLLLEAEQYIREMPIFANVGIKSYEDLMVFRDSVDDEWTQEESDANDTLFRENCDYVGFRIQALEYLESCIGYLPRYVSGEWTYWNFNERDMERLREMVENGENLGIICVDTFDSTIRYTVRLAILLMLGTLVLVSPLLTSDRHSKIHYLQFSSRKGRKLIYGQLTAMVLSSVVLTTLMLLVFCGIFSLNGTGVFWNTYIGSDFNYMFPVFRLTYGQYILIIIALMYILTMGTAMLAFVLSRFSHNLITLVIKLIPAFTMLAYLCVLIFDRIFHMGHTLYKLTQVVGTEAYICCIISAIALMAALWVSRREKRVDIV